uniref:Uncharacterized protein n=1 Tax=Setaria italica TaxID=4555 RepID=K3XMG5_SETIT
MKRHCFFYVPSPSPVALVAIDSHPRIKFSPSTSMGKHLSTVHSSARLPTPPTLPPPPHAASFLIHNASYAPTPHRATSARTVPPPCAATPDPRWRSPGTPTAPPLLLLVVLSGSSPSTTSEAIPVHLFAIHGCVPAAAVGIISRASFDSRTCQQALPLAVIAQVRQGDLHSFKVHAL